MLGCSWITYFWMHDMPEVIISSQDPRFISTFWVELFLFLKTGLRFSTAFHPQMDGQSEVTIRVLEDFLWPYVKHRRLPRYTRFLWPSSWPKMQWMSILGILHFIWTNAVTLPSQAVSLLGDYLRFPTNWQKRHWRGWPQPWGIHNPTSPYRKNGWNVRWIKRGGLKPNKWGWGGPIHGKSEDILSPYSTKN